jgi:hypothetical protein
MKQSIIFLEPKDRFLLPFFKTTRDAIGDQIYESRCANSPCVLHDEFEEMLEYRDIIVYVSWR